MSIITQEDADRIVKEIKQELADKFGDIENIDIIRAMLIMIYCKDKSDKYSKSNNPVEFAYWKHLSIQYEKAVDATVSMIKRR